MERGNPAMELSEKALRLKERCDFLLKGQWQIIREALVSGRVEYNDQNKLKAFTFMRQFDDAFRHEKKNLTETLGNQYRYLRAARGNHDHDRLIPKPQYASTNRMNPEGELFIYLGIEENKQHPIGQFTIGEVTCFREIRAKEGEDVTIAEFEINKNSSKKKVVNLYVDLSIPDEHYIMELVKHDGNPKMTSHILMQLYLKMINENVFLPVDNPATREYDYAPFHAFANYFKNKGFDGIIYNSTVQAGGKNLVLFNPDHVVPIVPSTKVVQVSY